MKNNLIFPLILAGVGVMACGGDGARRGDQKAYETVQEGSAAGVTSTIQGPGETLPPITGTNADTTTAFTINPNAIPPAGTPMPAPGGGTLAGTLPASPAPGSYPMPAPQPMTSASTPRPSYPVPTPTTTTRPAPRPQPAQPQPVEEEPAPTDTSTTTASPQPQPAPPVTNTNPPPKPPVEQKPPADQDDEEEEPPPPPTNTDTRGGSESWVLSPES